MTSQLYGLAGKLLEELSSPVLQDFSKSWGFGNKSELEKLKNTVSAIEAVLLDAEEKQRTNNQVRDWLIKIKLVFDDLKDLLLEIATEAWKRKLMTKNIMAKEVHIFFSSSNQILFRLKMGRKVKLIRERLDAIASDCNSFNLSERREEMPTIMSPIREETQSIVPLDKFIGREEDKRILTRLLLQSNGENDVSVISVVGIGGLGKTTLARSIYDSEDVKKRFDIRMWLSVSDLFDVKLISEKIVESATKRKCEMLHMDALKDKLKNTLDGGKYLLVLDDVWNDCPIDWMKLEVLLTRGAKGSKILITSRSELVSRASKSVATHVLQGMSHEESWALFKQVTHKRVVDPASSTILGIGHEVVELCDGVPLVVKTIGSMLGLKERETDWVDFKKNVLPRITKDNEGKIKQILKWSYDDLSAPLKRCFKYCAIFPKDWIIRKDSLIRMWIAHGLIQLDGTTRSLEDVGEQYFMDLMDRSLFEVDTKGDEGTVQSFKMHDLIHDLASSIGGNEFLSIGENVNSIDMRKTRHAWVSSSNADIGTS